MGEKLTGTGGPGDVSDAIAAHWLGDGRGGAVLSRGRHLPVSVIQAVQLKAQEDCF